MPTNTITSWCKSRQTNTFNLLNRLCRQQPVPGVGQVRFPDFNLTWADAVPRTRRLQMAPFLAQAERVGATAPATADAPNAVAIDMSNVAPAEKESHSEALFGPPIPADAATLDSHIHPAQPHDQVSQAVVDGWVEKGKQVRVCCMQRRILLIMAVCTVGP
jgi:hypothetical protein